MTIATIISISGQAWARDEAGNLRELRVGDTLQEGETLVTSDNGRVELDFADSLDPTVIDGGQEVVMTPDLDAEQPVAAEEASAQDVDLEALLTAIDEGEGDLLEDLDATAAGAGGAGGEGGGHDFVRLARITENVNPLAYEYGLASLGGIPEVEGQAVEEQALEDEPDSIPSVGTSDLDGDGDMVWESALPEGSGGGSLTTSGTFQIDTGTDLLALIEVQDAEGNWIGIGADGTQVTGAFGILTVNTDGSWSYTLTQIADHPVTGETGEADQLADTFAVRVTDDDGDVSAPATLVIAITDDGPAAANDVVGQIPEDGSVDIDVFANDTAGADGVDLQNGIVVATGPNQGSVVYNGDGTFTYTAAPGAEGADSFSYTITDADGDTATATVSLSISGDSTPSLIPGEGQVSEAGLPDGSYPEMDYETTGGVFAIETGNDSVGSIVITSVVVQGVDVTGGGTVQGEYGTLEVTVDDDGIYSWTYTLGDNTLDHESQGPSSDGVRDAFTVVLTDSDGDSTTEALNIDIIDDVPMVSVEPGQVGVSVDESSAGEAFVDGSISATSDAAIVDTTVLFGADGAAASNATVYGLALSGTGTTTLATAQGDYPISLVATDATTITGQYVDGAGDTQTAFTVVINTDGTLTVTQVVALEHQDPANANDTLDLDGLITATVTVTDADGDTDNASVEIGGAVTFYDDGPSVTIDAVGSSVSLDETTAGEAFVDGSISATSDAAIVDTTVLFGADGAAASNATVYGLALSGTGTTTLATAQGDYPISLVATDATTITGQYVDGAGDTQTAFTVVINTDGTLTVTQVVALEHQDPANANDTLDLDGLITATVTVTDADGDTDNASVEIGGAVTFYDDGPSITVSVSDRDSVTLNTQDAELTDTATASFAAAFSVADSAYGADGAGTTPSWSYALSLVDGNGTDSGLTSGGSTIYLHLVDAEVIGSTSATTDGIDGTNIVFSLTVDSSGSVTLTQTAPIDHDIADTSDYASDQKVLGTGLVNLMGTVTITDSDGDTATDSVTLDLGGNMLFDDAGPRFIAPENGYLANLAGESLTGVLDFDDQIEDNFGPDSGDTVRFPLSLEALASTGLTSGGVPILFDVSEDGLTLTAYTEATGNIFTITLSPNAEGQDTYTLDMIGSVDGGAMAIDFNAGGYEFTGGTGEWGGFNTIEKIRGQSIDTQEDSRDLLLTPINADTLNTTANVGGVDNTFVNLSQGMRVDFVQDLSGDTKVEDGYVFDHHYLVNGATAQFVSSDNATVLIKAYDDNDSEITPYLVGDGILDTITAIGISYGGEMLLVTSEMAGADGIYETSLGADSQSFVVNFKSDGTATVAGVAEDTVISTYTGDGYNSIEFINTSEDSFQIGDFGTTVTEPGEPVDLSLPIEIVDGDGDIATGSLDIMLLPEGTLDSSDATSGVDEASSAAQPHLIGSDFGDTLTGDDQDNILIGGEGDDTLSGGDGEDILVGGPGSDSLVGGAGADTFVWNFGDQEGSSSGSANDTVTDFIVSEGDVLDVSDLLGNMSEGADLSSYIQAEESGSDTILHISTTGGLSVDGEGNIVGADQTIELGGVAYSPSLIDDMINDGQLDIE
ncbi:retention module-containing protein [Halomonas sp.]|uniref:retention module-containing protein n=1 Tax=Halomonas sp. TaxID=1486246 RepID=UPI00298E93D2|nr:retention module-containing protein [Halomonas sp.]MDW7747612.1 retention module-containing protein [Halomonas sp.]